MYCLLFILSLRQPGYPQHNCGPSAFRHPVPRILALSEVGCGLSLQPNLSSSILFFPSITSLLFFFEPIDFSEKKPQSSTTSSRSGLSVTFFRSAKYPVYQIKKPELRNATFSIRAFWFQTDISVSQQRTLQYFNPLESRRLSNGYYFFRISSNFSIRPTFPRVKFTLM